MIATLLMWVDRFALAYMLGLNSFYALLLLLSIPELWSHWHLAEDEHLTLVLGTEALPPLSILVPAHNEAVGIVEILTAIKSQLLPVDRLLVAADNCSDDTAKVATTAGAEVIERTDPARRAKGYAVDFGIQHLAKRPPDIVIIVDADCMVGQGAIDRLAR